MQIYQLFLKTDKSVYFIYYNQKNTCIRELSSF